MKAAPFTPEQQAILLALANVTKTLAALQAHEGERRIEVQVAALQRVLVEQGIVSAEAIEAATAHMQAALAVEEALDPERQAAFDEINRLMRQIQDEEGGS